MGGLEGLEEAAGAWGDAFVKGDMSQMYALFATECRDKFTQDEWAEEYGSVVFLLEAFSDINLRDAEIGEVVVLEVDGGRGLATAVLYSGGQPLELGGQQPPSAYVYEDGGWRNTDCPSIDEALGG